MSRRDQIVAAALKEMRDWPSFDRSGMTDLAPIVVDRILALIHPETPDPGMVERVAIALAGRKGFGWRVMGKVDRSAWRDEARTALAAARKWWRGE